MKTTLFAHKAIQFLLLVACGALLLLTGSILYGAHVAPLPLFAAITADSGMTLVVVLMGTALAAACYGTSLAYRRPLHELSHDAIMADLKSMMYDVIVAVHQGVFGSVPAHRNAESIAKWLQEQHRSLDASVAQVLGEMATRYQETCATFSEEELETLRFKAAETLKQEVRTQTALNDADTKVRDVVSTVARATMTAKENDDVYRRLERLTEEAFEDLQRIAPRGSNVTTITRSAE